MTTHPPNASATAEQDELAACKGELQSLSVQDVGRLRDTWETLRSLARAAGERHTQQSAEGWLEILALPIPDWLPGASLVDYKALLVDELQSSFLSVDVDPAPVGSGAMGIPFHLEAQDRSSRTFLFLLVDELPNPALTLRLRAFLHEAYEESELNNLSPVVLAKHGLPYGLCVWASGSADAQLLVSAEADTTMRQSEANVADLLYFADEYFGRDLDFDLASLPNLDAIAARLKDGGFGVVPYPWLCRIASYLGDVLTVRYAAGMWIPGEPPDDPAVFALPDGRAVNLIELVRRYFNSDDSRPLSELFEMIIDVLEDGP